jgi:DNA polymerase-3 subunit delta
MQLAAAQLPTHLQKGLRPLYVLHGDEALLVQEAADAIRAAARAQGYTERSVHTVAGAHFDWGEVLAAGSSLSLFADRQMVEIRIPSGKPGKDGSAALQQLAEAARQRQRPDPRAAAPAGQGHAQRRLVYRAGRRRDDGADRQRRARPAAGNGSPSAWPRRASAWRRARKASAPWQFFADRVEGNLLAAHQEISKLALLHPPGELSSSRSRRRAQRGALRRVQAVRGGAGRPAGARAAHARRPAGRGRGRGAGALHAGRGHPRLKRVKDAMADGKPLPMALREQPHLGPARALFERVLPRLSDGQPWRACCTRRTRWTASSRA